MNYQRLIEVQVVLVVLVNSLENKMDKILQKEIERILIDLGAKDLHASVTPSQYLEKGDYTTSVAMSNARELGKIPMDLAEEIKTKLLNTEKIRSQEMNFISKIEVVSPGFINFFLKPEYFSDYLTKQSKNTIFNDQKFFIEHTQPNPFKTFHIGHLMNNTIGESIVRLVKANGGEVQTATYHGDKGLHVAKAVWALQKGIDLKDAYAEGHKAFESDEKSKGEIGEINKKIYEESDIEINEIYEQGRGQSLAFFEEMYKRLDSHFDFHFFESESGEVGMELVKENTPKVFSEGEGGAIIFKGEDFEPKTHTRVFLNKDGLPTYEAKELGLAQIKKDFFDYDRSITITANEQDSFFKVVEVAIGEVFPELKGKLKHLSHGVLKLSTGKMSSRDGNIISAEDLISQVKEKALVKIKEGGVPIEEQDPLSEVISIGAIKYTILRQAIGGDIIFDFDKSISFEGDSGPYLQYATVRANSILNKADGVIKIDSSLPEGWQTTNLERMMEKFNSVVERAGFEYSPNYLTTYLTELAGEFNSFYAVNKIVDETDKTSRYKLAMTRAFSEVMTSGLYLLGIIVPSKM